MATISLAPPVEALRHSTAGTACWWRQLHSYVFIGVVVADIGLTCGGSRLILRALSGPPGWLEMAVAVMIGWLFSQCFLLGLWAALGGLSTVPRWLAVGGASAIGALATASAMTGGDWAEYLTETPAIGILALLCSSAFAVVLLPLRRLAGWRVDFDAAYHPSDGRRRGQLDLMDFAALTCAVALPLTLGRALAELMGGDVVELVIIVPIVGAIIFIVAAPTAYVVLARKQIWLSLAGIALWVIVVSLGYSQLALFVVDLNFFGRIRSTWGIDWGILAFHIGIAASVALPLGLLRCCGLKLLVVK